MSAGPAVMRARSTWWIPVALVLLGLVPSFFGAVRLAEVARGGEPTAANARFLAQPLPVVLHLLAVIPFSLLGAFQFDPALRRRRPAWHRGAGRVLVGLGLMSALTGLWMTLVYPWPAGDGVVLYGERLFVGVAMTYAIVQAVRAILRRDFRTHGDWMTRAYAIGLGAGTQVLTHLPWFILVGKPGESARAVLMGAGWVINMLVAEYVIRRNRERTTPTARTTPSGVPA